MGGKGSQCIGLTTLPLSCAYCLEIWEPQPPATLWACNRYAQGLLYLYTLGNPEEHDLMSTQYESLNILLQVASTYMVKYYVFNWMILLPRTLF